jgi:hypothetical protein
MKTDKYEGRSGQQAGDCPGTPGYAEGVELLARGRLYVAVQFLKVQAFVSIKLRYVGHGLQEL